MFCRSYPPRARARQQQTACSSIKNLCMHIPERSILFTLFLFESGGMFSFQYAYGYDDRSNHRLHLA